MMVKMKKVSFILVIVILLASLLIISVSSADTKVPNLVGTWKTVFAERDSDTTNYTNATMNETAINKYVIKSQNGQFFEGYKEISPIIANKSVEKEGFTGVISDDMTHAYIKQHINGFSIVDITSPDTMTVYNLFEQDPHGVKDNGIVRVKLVKVE